MKNTSCSLGFVAIFSRIHPDSICRHLIFMKSIMWFRENFNCFYCWQAGQGITIGIATTRNVHYVYSQLIIGSQEQAEWLSPSHVIRYDWRNPRYILNVKTLLNLCLGQKVCELRDRTWRLGRDSLMTTLKKLISS